MFTWHILQRFMHEKTVNTSVLWQWIDNKFKSNGYSNQYGTSIFSFYQWDACQYAAC